MAFYLSISVYIIREFFVFMYCIYKLTFIINIIRIWDMIFLVSLQFHLVVINNIHKPIWVAWFKLYIFNWV